MDKYEDLDGKAYGKIGPVEVKAGFLSSRQEEDADADYYTYAYPIGKATKYPPERLVRFLEIDATNKADVVSFCEDYKLFVKDEKHSIFETFSILQKQVKAILNKFKDGVLETEDINFMNKQIARVKPVIKVHKEETKPVAERLYLASRHGNSVVSLWLDLVSVFMGNSSVRPCKNCGNLFIQDASNQLYCEADCGNRYRARKSNRKRRNNFPSC